VSAIPVSERLQDRLRYMADGRSAPDSGQGLLLEAASELDRLQFICKQIVIVSNQQLNGKQLLSPSNRCAVMASLACSAETGAPPIRRSTGEAS
jgi:hypothetical protein